MAYKVIILYRLYMPSYFLGTFTEYPFGRYAGMRVLYAIAYFFIATYLCTVYSF